ncbi:MAG TPA: flagellar type III secretion system protein FliR [Syntrophomonas sp.]|jgi:flagellar biosynthetic protein FliR|nr:flagellar type III secretion system protein FliR [Syntrophomonas sp.]
MPFALEGFLLIMTRISGLFLSAPILSSRIIPVRVKVLTIIGLAAVMVYFIPVNYIRAIDTPGFFIAALAVEILIGYTIGFVAYMVFAAIQLAGQVMDMQMGFAIVNVVDPQSGTQIPLMGNLTQTISLLMYLAIDGHHYLFQALIQSYKLIPVLGLSLNAGFYDLIFDISVYMFVIAVKIAAPIVIAIMTADIAMGFIARTVPQMNVFIVGLPLKILVGLGTLFVVMPVYIWVFNMLFAKFFTYLDQIIKLMGM